jgi:AbrB family looped-hinge helix DNA binding protein
MIIKRELGEKGQVVIPKDIRDFLGLRAKSNVVFEIKDNEVILRPEQNPEEFLKDFFSLPGKKKKGSMKELKKIILEQYEDEIP